MLNVRVLRGAHGNQCKHDVKQSCTTLKSQLHSLISIRAGACSLIIFGTVNIWAVVEGPVPSADGPAPPLVQEVPVETGERPVLCAFMLYEQGALLSPELLQISGREEERVGYISRQCYCLLQFLHKQECIHIYLQYIQYPCL